LCNCFFNIINKLLNSIIITDNNNKNSKSYNNNNNNNNKNKIIYTAKKLMVLKLDNINKNLLLF